MAVKPESRKRMPEAVEGTGMTQGFRTASGGGRFKLAKIYAA